MRFSNLTALYLLASFSVLTGCAGAPARPTPTTTPSPSVPIQRLDRSEHAALIAQEQIGVNYLYGGMSPATGFDCSGLVYYSYTRAGVSVPRTTGQLWGAAKAVEQHDLRAGDLLFFSIEGKMSHVGMYLGERRFVHAPQSGRSVSVASLDAPFYKAALIRAGRLY